MKEFKTVALSNQRKIKDFKILLNGLYQSAWKKGAFRFWVLRAGFEWYENFLFHDFYSWGEKVIRMHVPYESNIFVNGSCGIPDSKQPISLLQSWLFKITKRKKPWHMLIIPPLLNPKCFHTNFKLIVNIL